MNRRPSNSENLSLATPLGIVKRLNYPSTKRVRNNNHDDLTEEQEEEFTILNNAQRFNEGVLPIKIMILTCYSDSKTLRSNQVKVLQSLLHLYERQLLEQKGGLIRHVTEENLFDSNNWDFIFLLIDLLNKHGLYQVEHR